MARVDEGATEESPEAWVWVGLGEPSDRLGAAVPQPATRVAVATRMRSERQVPSRIVGGRTPPHTTGSAGHWGARYVRAASVVLTAAFEILGASAAAHGLR